MKIQSISKAEAAKLISKNLQQLAPLPDELVTYGVDATELLICPNRFDLMAKYLYAKYRELNLNTEWANEMYDEHIRTFNNYFEADESQKNGIESFKNEFHKIIDDIKSTGFNSQKSLIPVGKNRVPCDGAHRIAASALFQERIQAVVIPKEDNYDYLRFQEKGFEPKWMDPIALEYCKLNQNTFIVNIFPSAQGKHDEVREIIKSYTTIYYEKEVFLSGWGPTYYIKQVYKGESWVGESKTAYSGAQNKASNCFRSKNPLRIFVIIPKENSDLVEMKMQIRELFQIGNHSIHINDTHEETIRMSKILLNQNSIYFLNHLKHDHFQKFESLLMKFKSAIIDEKIDVNNICVDGSSVMSAFGMREGEDLDYIHTKDNAIRNRINNINSHNDELHHYDRSLDDLLFNPNNHFFYSDVKFLTIDILREMKKKRGEEKDRLDVKIIDSHLKNRIGLKLDLFLMKLRRKQYILRTKLISFVLRKLHLRKQ